MDFKANLLEQAALNMIDASGEEGEEGEEGNESTEGAQSHPMIADQANMLVIQRGKVCKEESDQMGLAFIHKHTPV
jgi:hypothetical protein